MNIEKPTQDLYNQDKLNWNIESIETEISLENLKKEIFPDFFDESGELKETYDISSMKNLEDFYDDLTVLLWNKQDAYNSCLNFFEWYFVNHDKAFTSDYFFLKDLINNLSKNESKSYVSDLFKNDSDISYIWQHFDKFKEFNWYKLNGIYYSISFIDSWSISKFIDESKYYEAQSSSFEDWNQSNENLNQSFINSNNNPSNFVDKITNSDKDLNYEILNNYNFHKAFENLFWFSFSDLWIEQKEWFTSKDNDFLNYFYANVNKWYKWFALFNLENYFSDKFENWRKDIIKISDKLFEENYDISSQNWNFFDVLKWSYLNKYSFDLSNPSLYLHANLALNDSWLKTFAHIDKKLNSWENLSDLTDYIINESNVVYTSWAFSILLDSLLESYWYSENDKEFIDFKNTLEFAKDSRNWEYIKILQEEWKLRNSISEKYSNLENFNEQEKEKLIDLTLDSLGKSYDYAISEWANFSNDFLSSFFWSNWKNWNFYNNFIKEFPDKKRQANELVEIWGQDNARHSLNSFLSNLNVIQNIKEWTDKTNELIPYIIEKYWDDEILMKNTGLLSAIIHYKQTNPDIEWLDWFKLDYLQTKFYTSLWNNHIKHGFSIEDFRQKISWTENIEDFLSLSQKYLNDSWLKVLDKFQTQLEYTDYINSSISNDDFIDEKIQENIKILAENNEKRNEWFFITEEEYQEYYYWWFVTNINQEKFEEWEKSNANDLIDKSYPQSNEEIWQLEFVYNWWTSINNPFFDEENPDSKEIIKWKNIVDTNKKLIWEYFVNKWLDFSSFPGTADDFYDRLWMNLNKEFNQDDFQNFEKVLSKQIVIDIESSIDELPLSKQDIFNSIKKDILFNPSYWLNKFFEYFSMWDSLQNYDFSFLGSEWKFDISSFEKNWYIDINNWFYDKKNENIINDDPSISWYLRNFIWK